MRHWAARPGARYKLSFPGRPMPKWLAMNISNAGAAEDHFLMAVPFDGRLPVSAYLIAGSQWDRETGTWVKTDSYEFVTVGAKTVARPSADWKLIKEEDESEIQRGLFRGLASSRPVRAPHEEFAGYARVVTKAKKAEAKESVGDKECQVYEAEFTEEAARDMARALFPMGRWLDRMPEAKYSAGTRVWVDGEGRILKVETNVKISAPVQGTDIEMSATRSSTISDIDATRLEIPDLVKKALEGK